ncbi:MAG: UDP-N-acetylmuramoyl-L-alanine--D-glutamate ligase [Gammaproteobacteria bacterium]|jgi:UDP-N-acetylmuramoylalanine--D-glutamate ligase|nr:UDP-N-acetylmuramoyl-L-alanine--D-glutamate ligase [Gammaproteobacteria bacterium]
MTHRHAQQRSPRPAAARVLVVGLGKTGTSVARFLVGRGVAVAVTDTRLAPPGLDALRRDLPDVALFLGGFDRTAFAAAELVVVSPGVSVQEPLIREARARGVPVVGDIELFAQEAAAPVAAITGSNGKSTTTTLLGEMARIAGRRVAVGGNLGEPALDLLDAAVELYVLELSSFQLETVESLAPAVATVLNISADHMDRYPDLDAYAAAKARIFAHAGVAVVNRDDPRVTAMPGGRWRRGFTLGEPQPGDFGIAARDGAPWICRGTEALMPVREIVIPGRHNLANALAALAMGDALGLPFPAMREALRCFRGLAHRTALVGEVRGVRFYDDSKGTNVGSTVAALEGFDDGGDGRTVLIAGGDGKGQDFAPLGAVIARRARCVVLIGRDAPLIESVLDPATVRVHARDMADAVRLALEAARPGDRVLLSPACASFDMFRNYEHRGDVFADAVRRLPE